MREKEQVVSDQRKTLTVGEAAELLGISRAFAYKLVKRSELPSVRLGRRVVVPRKALEMLLSGRREPVGGHFDKPFVMRGWPQRLEHHGPRSS